MDCHSTEQAEIPACGYAILGIAAIRLDNIPGELKALPQWVAWKAVPKGDGKKPTKVPVNPATGGNAMSNNPATWGSFDAAVKRATDDGLAGIGMMFAGDDLVGIDLDGHVYDLQSGKFTNPLAEAVTRSFASYTEVSPSGTGVKTWFRSSLHPTRCTGTISRYGESVDYETYHRGRWFTVTGHVLTQYGDGQIQDRTAKYGKMLEEIAASKARPPQANPVATVVPATGSVADEEAMLRAALKHMDPDSEPAWFRYGCCLKWWGGRDNVGDGRARALWDEWSRKSEEKFDPATQADRWQRIAPDGGLTIGTIFAEAAEEGYAYGDAMAADDRQYHVERVRPLEAEMAAWASEKAFPSEEKPVVELPNIGGWTRTTITGAAKKLGDLFHDDGGLYLKSGVVVSVAGGCTADVDASSMQSSFERKARLVVARQTTARRKKVGGEGEQIDGDEPKAKIVTLPTNATQGQAEAILSAEAFQSRLPPLTIISRCPVLVDDGAGGLKAVCDYDRVGGVLVAGGRADEVPFDEAVALLLDCLSEFEFQSPSDRSRAIAALVTPALVQGGLLGGRAPIDLSEADQSQAGKSFRAKLVAAVYADAPHVVTQRKGGTGGIEESFSSALMNGASFISIENVRGKIDSQMIESALTEDRCDARVPYRRPQQVDMRRVCVMLTSNKAELTRDLSNRTSPVRIRKRDGYRFRSFDGLDLLGHVRKQQGRYLGAVFAVVRAWAAAGRPSTGETRHDFRAWAGTLDWIVRNLFGAAPLCDGVEEAKTRMCSPYLNWLREISLAVARRGRCGDELMTWEVVRLAHEEGIEVPGLDEGGDLEDDATMNKANQAVGRRLGHVFGDRDRIFVDGYEVERSSSVDADGRTKRKYIVRQGTACENRGDSHRDLASGSHSDLTVPTAVPTAVPPMENAVEGRIGGKSDSIGGNSEPAAIPARCGGEIQGMKQVSPYAAPYTPPIDSPIKTQCPPIPPMGGDLLPEANYISGGVFARSGSQECKPIGCIGGKPGGLRPAGKVETMPDDVFDDTFLAVEVEPAEAPSTATISATATAATTAITTVATTANTTATAAMATTVATTATTATMATTATTDDRPPMLAGASAPLPPLTLGLEAFGSSDVENFAPNLAAFHDLALPREDSV